MYVSTWCAPTVLTYGASKCATSSIAQYLVTPADTAAPTQPAAALPSATDLGVDEESLEAWLAWIPPLRRSHSVRRLPCTGGGPHRVFCAPPKPRRGATPTAATGASCTGASPGL